MPEYHVRDPRSNRTVVLRGDSPPTEQELHQIFARLNTEGPPASAPAPMPSHDVAPAAESGGLGATVADVALGAGKGLANTVIGLGELANQYVPGVAQVNQALYGEPIGAETFGAAREAFTTPENTAQRVGFGAEQIGEFFTPVGAAGKVKTAAEIAKAGGLTRAQGGSNTAAGVSAALTAAIPGAAALKRGSEVARRGAEKTVAQALGATKEWAKDEAASLAPEMLERGVKGSREAMLATATEQVGKVGRQIGAEQQAAAEAGEAISGLAVRRSLAKARDGLMVATAEGQKVPIEGAQGVVKRLDKLDAFVEGLGDEISVDKAAKIKTAWDRIVSKAGLYNQKAGASATDNASAWAVREAASSFRDLLAKASPTLDDLNQEYAFWKGLRGVLTETQRRTQAQGGGLVSGITGATGAGAGFASGADMSDRVQNAVLGGLAGRQLVRVMQSPAWRTRVSAPMKQKLAEALASGNAERISTAVGRIVAAVPAQMRPVPAH